MFARRLVASSLLSFLVYAHVDRAEAAGPPQRKIDTRGFSVNIPRDWKLHKRVEYGEPKTRISWAYVSPKRNYRLRTSISKDPGGTMLKLTDASIVRTARRVDDMEIVQKQVDAHQSYVILKTLMVRKKTQQPYLMMQVLVRPPGKKYVVGLNIAASGGKLAEFQQVAKPILESLILKETTQVLFAAPPAAKAGAKQAITPAKKR